VRNRGLRNPIRDIKSGKLPVEPLKKRKKMPVPRIPLRGLPVFGPSSSALAPVSYKDSLK